MDNLTISPAVLDDIPALDVLVNSAYRGESSKKGWTTEADLLGGQRTDENVLEKMITDPSAVILKCCDEKNNLIGCVYLQQQDNKMYLGLLTVSPEIQAGGIGKKLMAAAENYAAEKNCISVIMTVISVRHELISWYERRGYTNTGITKPFPVDVKFGIQKQPLEFIVMEKFL